MSVARFAAVFIVAASSAALPNRASAQDALPVGVVSISVHDSLGRSISGAELTVEGTTVRGVTDERGEIRFNAVRGGPATVHVRTSRISTDDRGHPRRSTRACGVRRDALADPAAARDDGREGRRKLHRPHGWLLSAPRSGHRTLRVARATRARQSLAADGHLPAATGVQITATRFIRNAIRFRGNGGSCWPLVWLDGAPLPTAEFDLDFLSPSSIEGIEVYSGISQIPPQFMGSRGLGSCGVIVVWSREGERRKKKRKKAVTATELADMVASLKVYTPDQVDIQARSDSLSRPQPLYPETLLFSGVTGQVLAEFVVDTLGHVELDTFGVIASTNPKFTQSVQRALPDWAYAPAMLNGKRVRQLVQQPFTFVVDSAVLRRSNRQ